MNNLLDPTLSPRLAGEITRYHTWPVLHKQSVAEHSWQLSRILLDVWPRKTRGVHAFGRILQYIVYHDMGEHVGDIPFPYKRNNPALKEEMDRLEEEQLARLDAPNVILEDWERDIVKYCELQEMWEYAWCEKIRGNRFADAIVVRCMEGMQSYSEVLDAETLDNGFKSRDRFLDIHVRTHQIPVAA